MPKECFKAIYVGHEVDNTKLQELKSLVIENGIEVEIKKCEFEDYDQTTKTI